MATLKDVAEASGLTVGTVSRVLNNRGYISPKTREKVYQVMKELNYQRMRQRVFWLSRRVISLESFYLM